MQLNIEGVNKIKTNEFLDCFMNFIFISIVSIKNLILASKYLILAILFYN